MISSPAQSSFAYKPAASLVPGLAEPACNACVTIPARDEEENLVACLDAFARQIDLSGKPLSGQSFEILLLLNNCSDHSAAKARMWAEAHPMVALRCVELTLPAEKANAGTARKLLFDTAWQRLQGTRCATAALLCTDADSTVAPDWIAQNVQALEHGADAVGGQIELAEEEMQAMPEALRRCYTSDRRYGELVAQLEDLLDPQPGDPWPRHQHHFGSSLACTPQAYAAAGGMPEASVLEDIAFVQQLLRAGLCLRHEPKVRIFTSGRLNGRATVGLAGQLRAWSELPNSDAHVVQSAASLVHRFGTLQLLRQAFFTKSVEALSFPTAEWCHWAMQALHTQSSVPDFLAAIDCDSLIKATFKGVREQPIREAIISLEAAIAANQA